MHELNSQTAKTDPHTDVYQIFRSDAVAREEYLVARDRLLNGLFKLTETNQLVDGMKEELAQLQPVLESKSKATADLLVQVAADQKEAETVKKNVLTEEREVKQMQEEIQVRGRTREGGLRDAARGEDKGWKGERGTGKSSRCKSTFS